MVVSGRGGKPDNPTVFFSKEVVGSSLGPLHEAAADDDTIHQFQIRDPTTVEVLAETGISSAENGF